MPASSQHESRVRADNCLVAVHREPLGDPKTATQFLAGVVINKISGAARNRRTS
jgi:hypothetical protein